MVTQTPEDKEVQGKWYRWNVRKNTYEYDRAKNAYLNKQKKTKSDRDYGRAIAGIALAQPEAISGLIEGITGAGKGNFDRLFSSTSAMTDEEIGLGVGMLVAYTTAGQLGARFGYRKAPSVKEIKESPKFKEVFPKNDINLDSAIITYKNYYDNAGDIGRARMNSNAVELQQAKYRAKYDKAVEEKDTKAIEKAQKEIDEFGNGQFSKAKREFKEQELKLEKMKRLENEAITEGERESVLQSLREETGNDTPRSDWMALFRLKNKRNPTRDELYEFTLEELKQQADTGNAPTIIGEWYDRYGGGNEEGISTDLQELGRRVMSMLDGGEIEPSGQFLMDNFSGAEREALETAYNNPSIWNNIKADYKKYLAGTTALATLGIGEGVIASQDTEESKVEGADDIDEIIAEEEKKDEDELDLVEATDRPEEFVKKGEEEEVVVNPDGSIEIIDEDEGVEEAEKELNIDPEEEEKEEEKEEEEGLEEAEKELDIDPNKEKGTDRLVPSGEPEPDVPSKEKTPSKQPSQSPDERDMSEFIEVELEEDFFRNTKDFKNIDELLRLTYRATADVYDDTVYSIEGEYYLIDGYSVPVLFHQIGNKLIVALRGTASIANIISDLYTTNPITIGENSLDYYEFFRERINEKNDIKFHAGFIQALVYPPSKQARLGSKLESDYTPLYAMIRENIDNFKGEVTDLIFTGHSLGGALASLCYYLYQNDTYNIDEKITNSVRCVSYGSPRFVIKGGEQYYNSICPNLIRCWNESDIVTYIPFYRGIPNINIIDGFIHVGKSFCLDNPLSRADINQYVVDMLQEEKPAMRGLRGLSVEEGVNACKTISSTNYQTDLIKGLFEQLGNGVEVKSSEEIILEMESKCIRELQQGENVGKVFSGIGLETTLMEAKVGEDPRQTQFYYGSLFGYVMGTNKKSVDAHRLTTYKENIDRLIALEIKSKVDVLEQAESLQQAEKENIVEAIVKEEIKEEVEDRIRIPIIGFTEQFSGMEIISVNNNV